MPELDVLIEKGEVCRALRAKTMFYQVEELGRRSGVERTERSSPEGPFWCAMTQSVLGPDGEAAGADECRPGRSCCETT